MERQPLRDNDAVSKHQNRPPVVPLNSLRTVTVLVIKEQLTDYCHYSYKLFALSRWWLMQWKRLRIDTPASHAHFVNIIASKTLKCVPYCLSPWCTNSSGKVQTCSRDWFYTRADSGFEGAGSRNWVIGFSLRASSLARILHLSWWGKSCLGQGQGP